MPLNFSLLPKIDKIQINKLVKIREFQQNIIFIFFVILIYKDISGY